MPRLSIEALKNVVMLQDPYPAAGKIVIEATTAGIVHRSVTWAQLQRMMPKLIALEAAREIDFYVTDTPADDPRGAELGLAGLPAISYLTEGSGPIVPGAAATTDHVLTGVNILAGQSQAEVRLGSATVDNDAIIIRAIQPGPGGAEYTVEITDNGGGATAFTGAVANKLVIDTNIGVTTFAVLNAEINALAGAGAYGASAVPLQSELPGTGAGLVAVTAETALVGGAGPGLTMTVGGVVGDITWVDDSGTNVRFGIDLSAAGPVASSSVISAVLRAGKQITGIDIPLLASALQFKGSIAANTDFPLIAAVQPGWMYRVTADVTDNAGVTYTNTGQSFFAQSEIAWNGTTWSELGTETTVAFVNNAASPYTVLATETILSILSTTGVVETLLPAGVAGKTFTIMDSDGDAGTNTITITPDGAETIEGAAALTLLHNFDSITLMYNVADTDWKILHRVENNMVRATNATIDMKVPAANVLQLNGGASRTFLIKSIQFVCTAGVALAGDVTVTVGTSVGGVEIAAAFPLTGLNAAGETYRVALDGVFPAILGDATLDISVTIGDTGGGSTGTMTAFVLGEEV